MTSEGWIAIVAVIGGALCNAVVCAFFYGKLASRVESNEENCDKHGKQIEDVLKTLHHYPGGLSNRVTRLERDKDDD